MIPAAQTDQLSRNEAELRGRFLGWQCRVRQLAMRTREGRPDEAATPAVALAGSSEPLGHIITVMSRTGAHSVTPELQHLARKTHDAAERRNKAIEFLSSAYYQKPQRFSDTLTATFSPGSKGAAALLQAGSCTLTFAAYSQRFDLACTVKNLRPGHALYQATWWHNLLFNARLHPQTVILGFEPRWSECREMAITP